MITKSTASPQSNSCSPSNPFGGKIDTPPKATSKHNTPVAAKIAGGAASGILEIGLFHPVDTVAKRLMNNNGKVDSISTMNQVVFKEAATKKPLDKVKSLWPGMGFATGYKVTQRAYKYGTQPIIKDAIEKSFGDQYRSTFGPDNAKILMNATAGSVVGLGEVALLPLDALKIKSQTNPESLKGRGAATILKEEGVRKLYRGAGWTAARNIPGSFALFGGNTAMQSWLRKGKENQDTTLVEHAAGSIAGSAASIAVTNPLDVVKVRVQAKSFNESASGMKVVKDIITKEGLGAFLKGLPTKLAIAGPKLAFSMTVAQQIHQKIKNWMAKD